jgi:hypothetical protein
VWAPRIAPWLISADIVPQMAHDDPIFCLGSVLIWASARCFGCSRVNVLSQEDRERHAEQDEDSQACDRKPPQERKARHAGEPDTGLGAGNTSHDPDHHILTAIGCLFLQWTESCTKGVARSILFSTWYLSDYGVASNHGGPTPPH